MRAGLVLLAACSFAPAPPPAFPRETHLDLKISTRELANGLRVVVVADPRATDVTVTMRYQVGAVDDPADHPGIAHLVEHLMFQQVSGSQTVFAKLEGITSFMNALTTFDATTYMSRAARTHLDELLAIEALRVNLRCTSISESAFQRERQVVIDELHQTDDAAWWAGIHAVYPEHHPYRDHAADTEATLRSITRDQACAFADAHYAPHNAVLVVSGAVDATLDASLRRFFGPVPRRTAVAQVAVPAVEARTRELHLPMPIDDDAIAFAWPIPDDPLLAIRVRAVAGAVVAAIDNRVKGRVQLVRLGGARAPMLAVVVTPGRGETLAETRRAAERGIESVPMAFEAVGLGGEFGFDTLQQSAIYALFASLEDSIERDELLAGYVLAGRDPNDALAAGFRGLRTMTRADAARIASNHLGLDHAVVATLDHSGHKRGHDATAAAPIHDLGLRRDPPDPAAAHLPAAAAEVAVPKPRTRKLTNGLTVVLAPSTSVPTVDVRLVFASGTADEHADKRGAALVAGYKLTFSLRDLNDMLRFYAAGGSVQVDVAPDGTSFRTRGLDMHLDLLLAGLRRLIRDGRYDTSTSTVVDAIRRQRKRSDDGDTLRDTLAAAMYGAGHPYVAAGNPRLASETLAPDDAVRFRAAHFTPDNATLVIAGRFDPELADRWIDYLFADWTGRAEARQSPKASSQPLSIARADDTAQLFLTIMLPAAAGDPASRLVAAEMLDELAGDVRHRLGASYGLRGALDERRLSAHYVLAGWIEANRAHEAIQLIATRIASLHGNTDDAARAFVAARDRVLVHLAGSRGSAGELAARAETDVMLARTPLADTSAAVRALTIEQMQATLADLDLSRAIVVMHGPKDDVAAGFALLGRTPTYVEPAATKPADTAPAETRHDEEASLTVKDVEDSLTDQHARLALSFELGYATGSLASHDATGAVLIGDVGYNIDTDTSVGVQLAAGVSSTTVTGGDVNMTQRGSTQVPIDVDGFVRTTAYDRLWGMFSLGLHVDVLPGADSTTQLGLGIGLAGGVDIVKRKRHRFGVFARVQGALVTHTGYSAFMFGLAYRR